MRNNVVWKLKISSTALNMGRALGTLALLLFLAFIYAHHAEAATFATDTFTDTTSTALTAHTGEIGATWAVNSAFPGSTAVITDANRLRSNTNSFSIYYASGTPASADYSVAADVLVWPTAPGAVGVIGRASTSVGTYYLMDYEGVGNPIKLYTIVNGSAVGTTATYAWTPTGGQTYRFKLSMVGSTITAYLDGAQIIQKTDSNITTAGKSGLFFNFGMTNSTGFHIDNFAATDIPGSTYTFTGPTTGAKGVASSAFTVTPNEVYTGTITIRPAGAGLTSPIALTFSNSSTPQTFTITPPEYGTITLTPTNNGNLSDPPPLTYTSSTGSVTVRASDLWENGYDNVANPRQSTLAFVRLTTDATVLKVTGTTTNYTVSNNYAALGLRVNGVDQPPLVFPSNGTNVFTVSLPSGNKTIDITSGPQTRPSSMVLGSFVDSFELQGLSTYAVIAPTSTDRLVVYGDSIASGYEDSVYNGTRGWVSLLRNARQNVLFEGFAYRAIYDDAIDAPTLSAFVSRTASYSPTKIWLAVGTNDYGLNRWSAASFGTAYASMLDALHTALPSTTLYCQTPIVRSGEGANGFGNTLSDYRTRIVSACTARSWTVLVDGTQIVTLSDLVSGLHPTTSGHIKYENFVAPFTTPALVSTTTNTAAVEQPATLTFTRALGSTFINGENITVSWGDGNTTTLNPAAGSTFSTTQHTYTGPGSYTIGFTNGQSWPNPSSITYTATGGGAINPIVFAAPTTPLHGFQISINGGQSSTTDRTVQLRLTGGADAARMSISNSADFTNAVQAAFADVASWDLCSSPNPTAQAGTCSNGSHTVYAQFFTASGQPSPVVTAAIILNAQNPSALPNPSPSLPVIKKELVVLPYGVMAGQLLQFKANPTIYLVEPEGLYPFDTYASFKQYQARKKRSIKKVIGPITPYTVLNSFARSVLHL